MKNSEIVFLPNSYDGHKRFPDAYSMTRKEGLQKGKSGCHIIYKWSNSKYTFVCHCTVDGSRIFALVFRRECGFSIKNGFDAMVCVGYQKRAELFVFGRFFGYFFVGKKK